MTEIANVMHDGLPPPPIATTEAALFLDLDGTLVEFMDDPSDVSLPARTRADVIRLIDRFDGAVAVITGRTIADVDRVTGSAVKFVAGVHGLEIRTAALHTAKFAADALNALKEARQQVAEHINAMDGILIEDKGLAFALHYRLAPNLAEACRRLAHDIVAEHVDHLDGLRGAMVEEVKIKGRDKGTAMRCLLKEPPFSSRIPIVLGDDFTDEPAFREAMALGGYGIIVGRRTPTTARYRLADVNSVHAWIRSVLDNSP